MRAPVLRVLPGTPQSAAAARYLTREVLGDGDPTTDTAVLLASELVTNSVTHSRSGLPGGTVTLALCVGPAGVLIQVRDDGGSAEPRLIGAQSAVAGETEHGYGLLLVAALADTWGTIGTPEGRVTWCRVGVQMKEQHLCDDIPTAGRYAQRPDGLATSGGASAERADTSAERADTSAERSEAPALRD